MRQESKSDRFRRVAEARTNKIITMIRLLGNCSNRLVYTYEKEQVHQIFMAIREETDKAVKRFMDPKQAYKKRFSLSESGQSQVDEMSPVCQEHEAPPVDRPTIRLPLPDGTVLLAECFDEDEYPSIHISWESGRKLKLGMKSELLCTVEYDTDRSSGHEVSVIAYQSHDEEPMYCKPFIMDLNMRKYIGYIPAVLFTGFYLLVGLTGASIAMSMVLIWLACFWISAFLLHKGLFWGGVFGIFPAIHMIYMGTQYTGQVINIEIPLGVAVLLFYVILGIYLWKKKDTGAPKVENKEVLIMLVKMALTVVAIIASAYAAVLSGMILISEGVHQAFAYIGMLVLPSLLLPLIWLKKRKRFVVIWLITATIYFLALGANYAYEKYDESITVNTAPNINVHEYLPFVEDSKIVKIDSKTCKLTEDLPVIDGAAAFFPVYSAFVNAVYPETTKLYDGTFEYNNTPYGYQNLAEQNTDIFIGVYPSEEQKAYAEECGTTFTYTPIGTEAFVFFVHKDNPIDDLTIEQIQGIYSGEITNWKQLGGKNEEIVAFQRNQGSGSQSMLERFMGDTPIMEAPTELVNDLMSGIVEKVSNYRSKSNSIGFSFRYYVEGIIPNPDIKMLSVDGVAPTADNIKNGKYPVVTPIYAVTYEENTNENVDKLLEWILSDEGQYIIEETGYVGVTTDVK